MPQGRLIYNIEHLAAETKRSHLIIQLFPTLAHTVAAADEVENLKKTRDLAEECHGRKIAVKAESGRIEGGEEGIKDTGGLKVFTTPQDVSNFLSANIDILTPSIGKIHGSYGPHGPESGSRSMISARSLRRSAQHGAVKLNGNKLRENAGRLGVLRRETERWMDACGSSGRA
ncbi:hypothetical protein CC80DRAFT_518478 [Byssothecium circinans]|uniref:Fructose-bisphosphate aldolase n=1 Tax=Byssothecium circinans TaxID=147558 RepID=A0A6A5TN48_9PLEO|nr:hypothetical protein CC80DRAFT_518478 [Byssothecium circinans]